jgi:hypothetical protein
MLAVADACVLSGSRHLGLRTRHTPLPASHNSRRAWPDRHPHSFTRDFGHASSARYPMHPVLPRAKELRKIMSTSGHLDSYLQSGYSGAETFASNIDFNQA